MGYSPWGCKGSDTTERLHFHFHFLFPAQKANPGETERRVEQREGSETRERRGKEKLGRRGEIEG